MGQPNFLGIGAQKAATFWLWQMLKQHPEIFLPRKKELHFFNKQHNYEKGIDWYLSHFNGHTTETAVGEFTPNYFWTTHDPVEISESHRTQDVPQLAYKHYPDIKLIISLRDPVQRAISAYFHHVNRGYFSPLVRFADVSHSRGVITMGFYYTHLMEWLKYFERDQILVLIYEDDILKNKDQTVRRVYRFLDVDPGFQPREMDRKFKNRPKGLAMLANQYSKLLGKVISRAPLLQSVNWPKVSVSEKEIETLTQTYAKENQKLERLLGRDLSAWQHP